jgi:hypothetical protein
MSRSLPASMSRAAGWRGTWFAFAAAQTPQHSAGPNPPGEHTRNDRGAFLAKLADILARRGEDRVSMMLIDSAFGAPYVERLRMLGYEDRAIEVTFGSRSSDQHQAIQKAEDESCCLVISWTLH